VTATAPRLIVLAVGWRGLFSLLAAFSAVAALLVRFCARRRQCVHGETPRSITLCTIYTDPRFWRIAPLSALGVGASWSLQGLWAAPWLKDVEGLDRATIVQHLSVMAVAVSASGLLLGLAADRLRRSGVRTELVLACSLALSMVAQLALVVGCPVPLHLAWVTIAAAGAATVLSYAILGSYFPREASGRANAALNLLHVGAAFGLQSATGLIIDQWPEIGERYPAVARQSAMAASLLLQLAALAWFSLSPRSQPVPAMERAVRSLGMTHSLPTTAATPYPNAALAWEHHLQVGRKHASGWRFAAIASAMLCTGLTAALSMTISRPAVAVHIFEVDHSTHVLADHAGSSDAAPIVDPAALELARSTPASTCRTSDPM
jgi:hypothetical protein